MADEGTNTPTGTTAAAASAATMGSELPMAPNMTVRPQPLSISAPATTSANPPSKKKKDGSKANKPSTRAKSGCYTCRIRRKKCDEKPNEHGACETCVRLRLQCLGFGAKRPDWLRSQANVAELRNRIKDFLASQGMIKGHANANRPPSDLLPAMPDASAPQQPAHPHDFDVAPPQPALLSLEDPVAPRTQQQASGAHDSPSPPLNGEGLTFRTIQTSAVRESSSSSSGVFDPALPSRDSASPQDSTTTTTGTTTNGYSIGVFPATSSSNSSVAPTAYPLNEYDQLILRQEQQEQPIPPPLPEDYMYTIDSQDQETSDFMTVRHSQAPMMVKMFLSSSVHRPLSPPRELELLAYYFGTVVHSQYILSNKTLVTSIIDSLVSRNNLIKDTAKLLSNLSWSINLRQPIAYDTLCQDGYRKICQLERQAKKTDGRCKATIGLLIVSVILFLGGRCPAEQLTSHCPCNLWMQTIANYVLRHGSDADTIRNWVRECEPVDRWIIHTGIWFDIIYSITTNDPPKLERMIDTLWNPYNGNQDDTRFVEVPPSTPSDATMASRGRQSPTYDQTAWSPNPQAHGDLAFPHDQSSQDWSANTHIHCGSTLPRYGQTCTGWQSNTQVHYGTTSSSHAQTWNQPGPALSRLDLRVTPYFSGAATPSSSMVATGSVNDSPPPYSSIYAPCYSPPVSPSSRACPFPSTPGPFIASTPTPIPTSWTRMGNTTYRNSMSESISPMSYQPQEQVIVLPINDGSAPLVATAAPPPSPPPSLSLLDGMGATPLAVWAICQANKLYAAKKKMRSCDSKNDFQTRGNIILRPLEQRWGDYGYDYVSSSESHSSYPHPHPHPEGQAENRELEDARKLSAEVWRETAKLYVRSVLEDDRPLVEAIKEGVKSTVEKVWPLIPPSSPTPSHQNAHQHTRAVKIPAIRNLYFPIFLAGVLAAEAKMRHDVLKFLKRNGGGVGNGPEVIRLLEQIWQECACSYRDGATIPWRQRLKESHLLLI